MSRGNYLPMSQFILLDNACAQVTAAFGGSCPYLVGSSAERADWRDVDLRLILPDDEYDAILAGRPAAFWSLLCLTISEYLRHASGLPVDFQIQRRTEANAEYPGGVRSPLGRRAGRLYAGGPDHAAGTPIAVAAP